MVFVPQSSCTCNKTNKRQWCLQDQAASVPPPFCRPATTAPHKYSTYHITQVSLWYAILYMQADSVASTWRMKHLRLQPSIILNNSNYHITALDATICSESHTQHLMTKRFTLSTGKCKSVMWGESEVCYITLLVLQCDVVTVTHHAITHRHKLSVQARNVFCWTVSNCNAFTRNNEQKMSLKIMNKSPTLIVPHNKKLYRIVEKYHITSSVLDHNKIQKLAFFL